MKGESYPPSPVDVESQPLHLSLTEEEEEIHGEDPCRLVIGSSSSSSHDVDQLDSAFLFRDYYLQSDNSKKRFQRSKTAPAMAVMREDEQRHREAEERKPPSGSLVTQAALLLIIYLSLGVIIYCFNPDHFSGIETHPVVDALYFCIVTMCTIGYGDIAPLTPAAKLFACFFVLVGFGFIDVLLSGVVNYVLDLQEEAVLSSGSPRRPRDPATSGFGFPFLGTTCRDLVFDSAKGRMRIRVKVGLAMGAVLLSIGMGSLVLHSVEGLGWVDSAYLAVMSVTTVGYGDRAFKTLEGRVFASVWLLFSTLAVARAFLYLAEARIDKRHRRINKWVLHRQITVQDLLAADINHNTGFISKSEYIIYKLKEMGKIREKDILQICDQFDKHDRSNSGKITFAHLLATRNM